MENTNQTSYTPVIIALIIGVILGFLLNAVTTGGEMEMMVRTVPNNETAESGTAPVDSTLVAGAENETAFTIQVESLPSAQQMMLRAAGVDGDSVVITKGMVACAETKMGASRVIEIQNGAQISMSEGSALIGCYNN
jgi:mannose/fructose/N-acetylgalactosamine-specific phosphotransferase system component IIC